MLPSCFFNLQRAPSLTEQHSKSLPQPYCSQNIISELHSSHVQSFWANYNPQTQKRSHQSLVPSFTAAYEVSGSSCALLGPTPLDPPGTGSRAHPYRSEHTQVDPHPPQLLKHTDTREATPSAQAMDSAAGRQDTGLAQNQLRSEKAPEL